MNPSGNPADVGLVVVIREGSQIPQSLYFTSGGQGGWIEFADISERDDLIDLLMKIPFNSSAQRTKIG